MGLCEGDVEPLGSWETDLESCGLLLSVPTTTTSRSLPFKKPLQDPAAMNWSNPGTMPSPLWWTLSPSLWAKKIICSHLSCFCWVFCDTDKTHSQSTAEQCDFDFWTITCLQSSQWARGIADASREITTGASVVMQAFVEPGRVCWNPSDGQEHHQIWGFSFGYVTVIQYPATARGYFLLTASLA